MIRLPIRVPLIYSVFTDLRHSGESRNPEITMAYWMPVFTGMTAKMVFQTFLRVLGSRVHEPDT